MPSGVVLSVSSQTGRIPGRLVSGTVMLANSMHSLALLRYEFSTTGKTSRLPTVPERTPLTVSYGQMPLGMETFYGYVHHHEVLPTDKPTTYTVEYTFIGASLPLNQQTTRSWPNVSASYIAKVIAGSHGFRTYVHKHDRVFDYVVQDGISDLAMLQRLADDVGYRFWCHNGTLWFTDPAILVSGPKSQDIPEYTMNKAPGMADSLRSFQMIAGSMVSEGGILANRSVFGYDPRSKTFIRAQDSTEDAFLSQVSKTPVSSLAEAYAALAAEKAKNRNWLVAKARVDGKAKLQPGSLVRLTGAAMTSASAGYWLVTGAEHEIDLGVPGRPQTQRFYTHLDLVRNTDTTVTFKDLQSLTPNRETATARLNHKGLWEADLIEDYYLG